MKLDKYKVKKHIVLFFVLSFLFLTGIICSLKIFDCFIETDEIEAVVTHTFETNHNVHTHNPGGDKMNIEWVDLDGEVQTEGSILNREALSEGDTYTILVDAKTHSRRVTGKVGSVVLFVVGVICCGASIKLINIAFGRDDYN